MLGLVLLPSLASAFFPLVRESQLPLYGKRVLVAASRAEAAPLAAALITAGARPLWCEGAIAEPLDESSVGQLDDAMLRLTEYDLLLLLSRSAVDAIAQRGLLLSDSSTDALQLMLRASGIEVAAMAPTALHLSNTLGLSAIVPADASADGLSAALAALGTLREGTKVLVPTAQLAPPLREAPNARACIERLRADGALVECVEAYALRPAGEAALAREAGGARGAAWLHEGFDAVCVGSALDAQGLAHSLGVPTEGASGGDAPFVVAVSAEADAASRELFGWEAGLVVSAGSPDGQATAIVDGLERHFSQGRLLF